MGAQPSDKRPDLLTVKAAAASLKLPEDTVVSSARSGLLPAVKVGREWRFRVEDVQRWLEIRNETPEEFAPRTGELIGRISEDFRKAGITKEDIRRVIEEVRRERRAKKHRARSRA